MKNKKTIANQEYKESDLEIADQMQAEIVNKTSNKVDPIHQSNTEMEFVEHFNPDDFE